MKDQMAHPVGKPVKRKEDRRFLTGQGQYTDDITLARQAYAAFVRSPHAHAKIDSIDTSAAKAAPGVIAVYTGADLAADGVGNIPTGWLITDVNKLPMKEPPHSALAVGKVRHGGEAVAVVIADTAEQARNAAEQVAVEYTELPSVTSLRKALDPGAPVLYDDHGLTDNKCFTWSLGDKAATEKAFAAAAHVVALDLDNNRVVPNPMEPRACNAEFHPADGSYTVYVANQNPHLERMLLSAFVLHVPEHKIRVIAPDVGGGFGSKINLYPEDVVVTWAARKCERPVKWTASRSEAFLATTHGRDHFTHCELALDADGKFLGLRVHTVANLGAYLATFGPAVPTYLYGTLLAGQYTTPAIYCEEDAVFTNTTPVDAYRGAGRPEACYVVERLASAAAWQLGLAQDEIRRRNFITTFPYQTPVALEYDVGDYNQSLVKANELADVAGFAQRKRDSAARGLLRGLGYSCYIEACGLGPSRIVGSLGARAGLYESGTVRVNPTGSVTVFTGTHSHGQGHETAFAQLVADRLGLDVDMVDVVHGDTGRIAFGMGTYGSRSLSVGGGAIAMAVDKVVAKGTKIAAFLLEASEADIEFTGGRFVVKGTDKGISFGEVALAAYVPHNYPLEKLEPGLEETAFYDPANFVYPAGTYICEVEVDPETGVVRIDRFTCVDDFGNIVNPMLVDGQVHGGVAQGVGQALLDETVYDDETGQLLTGSYMDYALPRADDLPSIRTATVCTPCTHNPLGTKGCGEAGAIGAPPAVINAVIDALRDRGITSVDMPATPQRVWRALQQHAQEG